MSVKSHLLPSTFARKVLRLPLYPIQQEIVDAFYWDGTKDRVQVTCRTCNESGKTTRLLPTVICEHILKFPRDQRGGGVVCTSGSWNQIESQLMPALRSMIEATPAMAGYEVQATKIMYRGMPQLVAFSTDNPLAAEGFHGNKDRPLMVIEDEAKSVPDPVALALDERCNPQKIGYFSSPGAAEGHFYQSHTDPAWADWVRFKVPASMCPHITKESIERRIRKNGEESQIVRSAIDAEFMEFVEGGIFSLKDVELCWEHPPERNGTDRSAFLDFAAGIDENVIAFRRGNMVWIVDSWVDKDTDRATMRFLNGLNELKRVHGLRPEEVEGDDDGIGKLFINTLAANGWPIGRFHGNSAPVSGDMYANRITENWIAGADKVRKCQVILPRDEELKGQLLNRRSKGKKVGNEVRLAMETKEELRARGVQSPDRADAVLGALGVRPFVGNFNLARQPAEEYEGKEYLDSPQRYEPMEVAGTRC